MRAHEFINESRYGGPIIPYQRDPIKRGDSVIYNSVGHKVVGVEGSKYVLDNNDIVTYDQIKKVTTNESRKRKKHKSKKSRSRSIRTGYGWLGVNNEVDSGGDGGGVEEAMNPAQQAAIAVNMKKSGKKPKTESLTPDNKYLNKEQKAKIKGLTVVYQQKIVGTTTGRVVDDKVEFKMSNNEYGYLPLDNVSIRDT